MASDGGASCDMEKRAVEDEEEEDGTASMMDVVVVAAVTSSGAIDERKPRSESAPRGAHDALPVP